MRLHNSFTLLRKHVWCYPWYRGPASSFPTLPYSLCIPPSINRFTLFAWFFCILHVVILFVPLSWLALDLQLPCLSDCGSTGCTHQDWGSSRTAKDTNDNEGPGFGGLFFDPVYSLRLDLIWSDLVWVFEHRLGIWPTTSCAFCANSKALMRSFLQLMLAEGEKTRKNEGKQRSGSKIKDCRLHRSPPPDCVSSKSAYQSWTVRTEAFIPAPSTVTAVPSWWVTVVTKQSQSSSSHGTQSPCKTGNFFPFLMPRLKGGNNH